MAYVIGFAGKGGTGKTTIAALTVRYLLEKKNKTVMAVDADSNSCLNEALGVPVYATIGKLREESLDQIRSGAERPGGMSMEQLFDFQVQQSIIESKGFDLMVMGRPEGPGCYCAANNIIRKYTDKLSEKYNYVVIDNLVDELKLDVNKRKLIVNRVSGENFEKLKKSGIDIQLEEAFNVPEDENIFHLDLEGRPVFDLPSDSIAVKTVFEILDSCNIP